MALLRFVVLSSPCLPMPHHVYLTFEEAPTKERCAKKDLSEDQLKKTFVRPYLRGQNLLLDGNEVIAAGKVRRVKITSTSAPLPVEVNKENERRSRENDEFNSTSRELFIVQMPLQDDDCSHLGEDVTAKYIKEAPGSEAGAFARVLKDQWTVQIVGGLILAGILALGGWLMSR